MITLYISQIDLQVDPTVFLARMAAAASATALAAKAAQHLFIGTITETSFTLRRRRFGDARPSILISGQLTDSSTITLRYSVSWGTLLLFTAMSGLGVRICLSISPLAHRLLACLIFAAGLAIIGWSFLHFEKGIADYEISRRARADWRQ